MGERRSSQVQFSSALESLLSATNLEQELCRLQDVQNAIITNCENAEDIERNWLLNSGSSDCFARKTAEDVLATQEHANLFLFYVFDRRYGWAEGGSHLAASKNSNEARCKASMNEILDECIKW